MWGYEHVRQAYVGCLHGSSPPVGLGLRARGASDNQEHPQVGRYQVGTPIKDLYKLWRDEVCIGLL